MYTVYILKTSKGNFYTGIAKDLNKRLNEHKQKSPKSAKYLRTAKGFSLVYQEVVKDRSAALKREANIKKLTHAQKTILIAKHSTILSMNKVPPFVANSDDDVHCVNAVYRMVFLHYFNKAFTWDEIDARTYVIPGKGIWSVPGDILLAKEGLKVTNIEPVDYEKLYSQGPQYLKQVVGEQAANYYFTQSNIAKIIPLIPEFLSLVHHETRRATVDEVLKYLADGKLVAAEVNSALLNNKAGFMLHFVLLYDFDREYIFLHDPGLPPHPARKITRDEFMRCWSYKGSNGGIEVFG